MSEGSFVRSKYAAEYGDGSAIHPIRVQPETIALTDGTEDNDPPAGAITNPISAIVSRSKRGLGLKPRTVTIALPLTGVGGYKAGGTVTLPILNIPLYDALQKGDTVTYNGFTCTVVSKSPESAT